MLLTAVTAALEQGAWGHYQLSNPPYILALILGQVVSEDLRLVLIPHSGELAMLGSERRRSASQR
jgi:TctA family transporter